MCFISCLHIWTMCMCWGFLAGFALAALDILTFFPFRPGLPSSPGFPCGKRSSIRCQSSGEGRKGAKRQHEGQDLPMLQGVLGDQVGLVLLGGQEVPKKKKKKSWLGLRGPQISLEIHPHRLKDTLKSYSSVETPRIGRSLWDLLG